MDVLSMGGCVVLDGTPRTEWPTPLRRGEEFLSLDVLNDTGKTSVPSAQYLDIPEKIVNWLANEKDIRRLSKNSADYFDREVAPASLARVICERVIEA